MLFWIHVDFGQDTACEGVISLSSHLPLSLSFPPPSLSPFLLLSLSPFLSFPILLFSHQFET